MPVRPCPARVAAGDARLTVLVAGGGVTGLAAAHALVRAGVDVTLVERSSTLGGKVATDRIDGFVLERGADSFLILRPAALTLCRELGLADEVVAPLEPGGTFVWHDERLVPVPDGTGLGVPTRLMPFLASPLFTPLEKLRAAMEVAVPAERSADDVSIGTFLRRRFGSAVVDRLAGPLISGIYGAAIDELSLEALMPRLREAVRRHGSLVRAGLAARDRGPAGPLVVTLRRGMGSLIDALAARLGRADLRLGVELRRIERAGAKYAALLGDGSRVDADAVVLATPAPMAARALADLAPAAADALAAITYRGTAAVSLAYDARQLAGPLSGHGFVVPDGALPIAACTWTSAKWPQRAPQGTVLLRATIRSEALLAARDDALVDAAHDALARVLRIDGRPVLAQVARWEGAMPRYTVGHLERVERIVAALHPFPGLILAGAAYRGAGVPDRIIEGETVAETLLRERTAAA